MVDITVVEVEVATAPTVIEVEVAQPVTVVSVAVPGAQGPQGEDGPDAWDIDVTEATVSGAVSLTYSRGAYYRLILTGDVQLTVTGWPAANKVSRLTVEAHTSGAYDITDWPAGTEFSYQIPLSLAPNGRTRFVLSTSDGGSRVFCDPIGERYGAP